MKLLHAISVVLTSGLVAIRCAGRPSSLSIAILALARSMDISHLYSRQAPGSADERISHRFDL